MAKTTTRFVCRSCGAIQSRWLGKCPDCGEWDALEAVTVDKGASKDKQRGIANAIGSPADANDAPQAVPINEVDETTWPRMSTRIAELDRVLGSSNDASGLVPGSTILIGGDPGIGKSTLLLQAANQLAESSHRVLYVTSEESAHQTRLRAQRLKANCDELYVLADTNVARVIQQAQSVKPQVLVLDSIQMIYKGDLEAPPGSLTQLRACCMELVYLAKSTGIAVFLVGHVTKEGRLAGPRLLEHLVDCVLYFEGDRFHSHRIIRAIKNRFGTTLEVGLFEMTESGLQEVGDAGGLLAAEYLNQDRSYSGSIICPVIQGSRCMLVEVQALTADGFAGAAKRKTSGVDSSRLAMLIAVLEKRGGLRLADQDIFVSAVGGLKIQEPAADLAVALAIAGAHMSRELERGTCVVGEVGLGGEIRSAQQVEQRLREATRLGFKRIICPPLPSSCHVPEGCEVFPTSRIETAMNLMC